MILEILLVVTGCVGTLILLLINMVLSSIRELKTEIKLLQRLSIDVASNRIEIQNLKILCQKKI
jgi:Tfp pilus assembly protein PilN